MFLVKEGGWGLACLHHLLKCSEITPMPGTQLTSMMPIYYTIIIIVIS
jgi:hypothetical protein